MDKDFKLELNKKWRDQESARKAARGDTTEEAMIVDDTIDQLGTVMGDDNPVDDDDSGNETEDEVEGFPLGTFQVEESDDEEAELNWMDFVGVAAGQINSEPEDLNESADSPLFRREEETIANVRPETSAWYPFVNRERLDTAPPFPATLGSLANNAKKDP
ncbi:hypothetical protein PGT21_028643 [Puccinia graminis f. sp. tritici]|uniref:Uncharacterized protein n=1 Tax=Puccinia graminis f. sp. tritici TaxID=56615 RepID=A0A5B0PZ84_PUCGR|nr:hypothetical protein PGT21_028643 [Puccinia graminis f. sp. tritici]